MLNIFKHVFNISDDKIDYFRIVIDASALGLQVFAEGGKQHLLVSREAGDKRHLLIKTLLSQEPKTQASGTLQ